jgi:hypothetical protein
VRRTPGPEPARDTFTPCSFVCFLHRTQTKFSPDGMIFSLVVPWEYEEDALPLRHLVQNPLPLEVTVRLHEPYLEEDRLERERILSLIEGGNERE